MVDSQPGTVIHFDPSVSLSNFSAEKRDHLIFNENQLVLVKVQRLDPVFAHATNRSTSNVLTVFDNYKNTDGKYVYIDDSFQALTTPGVPNLPVHRITVGFDRQVSTNIITFWSITFVDTTRLFVEYSFDNTTWFSAGTVTWVQEFDDTIQIAPDDDPPTGEFKYTGTRSAGSLTARYWRIRSDVETTYTSGTTTVTVPSTTEFPTTGTFYVYRISTGSLSTHTYTGKTATTFTGVSPTVTATLGDIIFALPVSFADNLTEIRILQTTDPILQHWNSDGTQAVTNLVEGSDYYQLAYDKNEDVYYAIRLNRELSGNSPDLNDNFDANTGSFFDSTRWTEDSSNIHFIHNTSSGTLDYKSPGGKGQLSTNYSMTANYITDYEASALLNLPSNDVICLEAKDADSDNQYIISALRGPYPHLDSTVKGALHVYEFNTTNIPWSQKLLVKEDDTSALNNSKPVGVSTTEIISANVKDGTAFIYNTFGTSVFNSDSTRIISVDINGSIAAAIFEFEVSFIVNRQLRIFEKASGTWSLTFTSNNYNASATSFGDSVAVGSTWVMVGAPATTSNKGGVEVFTKVSGNWSLTQSLSASDGLTGDRFGESVSISSNTMLVGAPNVLSSTGAVYVFRFTSSWAQSQKLTASDAATGDSFGKEVGISGLRGVIGAPGDDPSGSNSGAAYYFLDSGSSFSQQQKLTASDGSASAGFGFGVDIDGTTLVISTETANKVYVFTFSSPSWSQNFIITPPNAGDIFAKARISSDLVAIGAPKVEGDDSKAGVYVFERVSTANWLQKAIRRSSASDEDALGRSVAAESSVVIGGIPLADTSGIDSGLVHVYDKSGGLWADTPVKRSSSDIDIDDLFGSAVTTSSGTFVAGAPSENSDTGACYAFAYNAGLWTQTHKIIGSDSVSSDIFGTSVCLHNEELVVGAPGRNGNTGAAYVFNITSSGTFDEVQILTASDAASGDFFGYSVYVKEDIIVVGAYGNDDAGSESGAAYVFTRDGGVWSEADKIVAADATAGDRFGWSVATSSGTVVVGAPKKDSNAGAAYLFQNSGGYSQVAKFQATTPTSNTYFGWAVGAHGVRVAATSYLEDNVYEEEGAVYVFKQHPVSLTWSQEQKIHSSSPETNGRFGYAIDMDSDIIAIGSYTDPIPVEGTFEGVSLYYSDTLSGKAVLQNFRLDPKLLSYSASVRTYVMTYNSGTGKYNVTINGTPVDDATPGSSYSYEEVSFIISNLETVANGQSFTVVANLAQNDVTDSTSVSGTRLQIQRLGTNSYIRYKQGVDSTYTSLLIGNTVADDKHRLQIYGDASSSADIAIDNFVASGTSFYDSPVFSIVTVNKDGNLQQVSGLSDSEGYAIKRLDIIQDVNAEYNDFITPQVGIATNGLAEGSGGEIYIKYGTTIYKYLKNALPLDLEDGSNASVVTTGEIPETGISNFAYNGYSAGGLSYIQYISSLDGVFVKSIATTTLTSVANKALLDASSADLPFAWNVSDLSTLYFVEDTDLKLYDLNETKAGFVNVTSNKQVLAAGTSETAIITAQVLNVYGEPKSNKSMVFSVSAGDGAISPAAGCSDVNGEDTTTYTVGAAVGVTVLVVTVSDISC